MKKVPAVHSIAIGYWVKNRIAIKEEDEAGISHLIEHLLFKGTKKKAKR